ncbi:rhodanese-like domain-containing protein [Pedobacter jamesrossensis]|uniref:Rhodanese-like domain-containing protein n=1 Tax=Pedobacter jamesrossensis TaxID=1908238 RepID=A0ABV8NPA4_9SPHI
MNKLFQMISSFFSTGAYDLDGYHFKNELKKSGTGILLDVRTGSEYATGKLPSAVHIDYLGSSFATELAKLNKGKRYFVYCRSGNRSSSAVLEMRKLGFEAFSLAGGISAWPK